MSLSKKVVKGLSWDFLGITFVNIIGILTSIIFVRILNAKIYGVFVILINFYQMMILFTSFGMDTTLLKFYSQWKADQRFRMITFVTNFILKFRVIISVILGVILFFFADYIGAFVIKKAIDPVLIRLIGIFFIITSFQGISQQILIAEYQQTFINIITMIFFLIRFLGGVMIIALFNGGLKEIIIIFTLAQAGILITFSFRAIQFYLKHKTNTTPRETLDKKFELKKLSKFAFFAYLYIALGYILGKGMDIFLIGKLISDTRQATYYALAHGFSYMVISFSARAFSGGIPLSLATELYTKNQFDKLRIFFRGFFEALYFFIIPMSVGAWIIRADVVKILYGEGFETVSIIIGIFLVTMIFLKFSSITSTFIIAMGWERKLVFSRLILGIINFVLDILFIPKWGALGAVIASTIAGFTAVTFETILLAILLKPKVPWKFIGKTILASAVMGGLVYIFRFYVFQSGKPIPILVVSVMGGMIYFSIALIFKPISKDYFDILGNKSSKLVKLLKFWSEK